MEGREGAGFRILEGRALKVDLGVRGSDAFLVSDGCRSRGPGSWQGSCRRREALAVKFNWQDFQAPSSHVMLGPPDFVTCASAYWAASQLFPLNRPCPPDPQLWLSS